MRQTMKPMLMQLRTTETHGNTEDTEIRLCPHPQHQKLLQRACSVPANLPCIPCFRGAQFLIVLLPNPRPPPRQGG